MRTVAPAQRPWWLGFPAIVLLLVVSSAAYLNAGGKEFFFDSIYLTSDSTLNDVPLHLRRLVESPWRFEQEFTFFTFAANVWLNKQLDLDGLNVNGFLAVNVLIHAINVCLVYLLLDALMRRFVSPSSSLIPLAVAVLFAVHPLHPASVVYIMQRRGLLATMFYLMGLLIHLRLRSARRGPVIAGWACLIMLALWLSAQSKVMGLTLPIAIVALEFCFAAGRTASLQRFLIWAVPMLAICTASLAAYASSLGMFDMKRYRMTGGEEVDIWGPLEHFYTQMRVFVQYWKLMILPLPQWLSIEHEFPVSRSLLDHYAWAALLIQSLIGVGALFAAARRWALLAFGLFLFYIALLPYMLMPQPELLVEYKTYLSAVGAAIILVEMLARLRARIPWTLGLPAFAAVAVGLLAVTLQRNAVLRDNETLWRDVLARYPDSVRGHMGLALAYETKKQHAQAAREYREVLARRPHLVDARYSLANELRDLGDLDEAIKEYREARRLNPHDLQFSINLGDSLVRAKRFNEALVEFQDGLKSYAPGTPSNLVAKAHFNLANTHWTVYEPATAEIEYKRVLEIDPKYAKAHYGLAIAAARRNDADAAIAECLAELAINPNYDEAKKLLKDAQDSKNPPPEQ